MKNKYQASVGQKSKIFLNLFVTGSSYLIIFASGLSALVYEVVWQKMLGLVFGDTIIATTTVVSSFMAGLAVGSWFFGRLSDRYHAPLRLLAFLELGIAISGFASIFLLVAITPGYVGIARLVKMNSLFLHIVKFLISFPLLLIPTTLMGGTLPIIAKFLIRDSRKAGSGIGRLYAVNTLGAISGCILSGFILISSVGMRGSIIIAAFINAFIAGALFLMQKFGLTYSLQKANNNYGARQCLVFSKDESLCRNALGIDGSLKSKLILAICFLTGFTSLALEILWTRTLIFFIHSSVYAFATMLSTFLCGSAIGSLVYSKIASKKEPGFKMLAVSQASIGIWGFVSMAIFLKLDAIMYWFGAKYGVGWMPFIFSGFMASAIIMFVPTIFMGISFPLITQLYTTHFEHLGKSIGSAYAANTLGSVLGSFTAGFMLIPFLGMTRSLVSLAIVSILISAIIFTAEYFALHKKQLMAFCFGSFIVIGLIGFGWPWEKPLWINSLKLRSIHEGGKCLYYKEGLGSTITVTEAPPDFYDSKLYRKIAVDGTVVAGTSPMLRTTQKIQAHTPLLLYKAFNGKDPRYVFILGLGSGESSYSITLHNIERLDCAEIAPAEIGALKLFADVNHNLLDNPKFSLYINDARNHLLTTTQLYDVIESDAVHPDIAVNTYTKEYFELAKSKLTENGIFSSWIPLFNISQDNFKIMVKTLSVVFPHILIWYVPNERNKHALLIGTEKKLTIDFKILDEELKTEPIRRSLSVVDCNDIYSFLSGLTADQTTLNKHIESSKINTDNQPYLPYYIPRQKQKGEATMAPCLTFLIECGVPIESYLVNAPDSAAYILQLKRESREYAMKGIAAHFNNKIFDPIVEYEKALQIMPNDLVLNKLLKEAKFNYLFACGNVYSKMGYTDTAIAAFGHALQVNDQSAIAHNYLGVVLYRVNLLDSALFHFKKAIQLAPRLAEPYFNLAHIYFAQGRYNESRMALQQTLRINRNFEGAKQLKKKLKEK